jgi:hypothetical protein
MSYTTHPTIIRENANMDLVSKLRTESMDVAFRVGRPRFGSVDSVDHASRGNSFSAGAGAAGAGTDDLAAASVPPSAASRGVPVVGSGKASGSSHATAAAAAAAESAAKKAAGYAAALLAGASKPPVAKAAAPRAPKKVGARPVARLLCGVPPCELCGGANI